MPRKGQKHNICGAMMSDGIRVCTQAPGWGTDHLGFGYCKVHGGNTAPGRKMAAVREAKARAREFGTVGSHIDPHDALRQELARTNYMLEWAREMCQKVIQDHNKKNPSEETEVIHDLRFQSYRLIMDNERDRLVRIARSSLDSNIQARRQALAEALASVVIECFHSMTRSIPDLTPTQLEAAQEALKSELGHATERLLLEAGPDPTKQPTHNTPR